MPRKKIKTRDCIQKRANECVFCVTLSEFRGMYGKRRMITYMIVALYIAHLLNNWGFCRNGV